MISVKPVCPDFLIAKCFVLLADIGHDGSQLLVASRHGLGTVVF